MNVDTTDAKNPAHDLALSRLKGRRRLFVLYYPLCNHNGTEAAIRAGYSRRRASQAAYELMKHPIIKAALDEIFKKSAPTEAEVLARIGAVARGDLSDFIEFDRDEDLIEDLQRQLSMYDRKAVNPKLPDDVRKYAQKMADLIQRRVLDLQTQPYRLNMEKARERGQLPLLKKLDGNKIELLDPMKALDMLARTMSLFGMNAEEAAAYLAGMGITTRAEGMTPIK